MNRDLTKGSVTKSMLLFAIPMILGDLLQQCYNIADTLIVGQFLGRGCSGGGGVILHADDLPHLHHPGPVHGKRRACFPSASASGTMDGLKRGYLRAPLFCIAAVTVLLNVLAYLAVWTRFVSFCTSRRGVVGMMRAYLFVIFVGHPRPSSCTISSPSFLRSVGNSVAPLVFLAVSAVVNIVLDLWFVAGLELGRRRARRRRR